MEACCSASKSVVGRRRGSRRRTAREGAARPASWRLSIRSAWPAAL